MRNFKFGKSSQVLAAFGVMVGGFSLLSFAPQCFAIDVQNSSASTTNSESVHVKMKSISYDPKQVVIKAGQEIIWDNVAYTDHSATADEGQTGFDTGMVAPKHSSKAVMFNQPGSYPYHCSMHGKTMSGIVVVK